MTICKICGNKTSWLSPDYLTQGISMHYQCREEFLEDPQKYGGLTSKELEEKDRADGLLKKDSSQSEERSINLKNNNTGSVITDIDLPWERVLWVSFQFLVVGLVLAIPLWIFITILFAIAS